jgi:hypothetical protein
VAPAVTAYALTLGGRVGWRALRPAWLHAAGAGLLIAVVAAGSGWVASQLYALSGEPSWGPRVPLRGISGVKRGPAVGKTLHFLREHLEPGEPIYVARAEPLIYFAADAPNPTPFTGALQVWGIRKAQQERILQALEEVRFVVMSDLDHPIHTFFPDELPLVQAHLERFFRVPEFFTGASRLEDWMIVLARSGDAGPTAIDLVDPQRAQRAWVRGADGEIRQLTEPARRGPTRQNRRPLVVEMDTRGGGVDFDLAIPPDARFETGIGFYRIENQFQPDGTHFAVSVREREQEEFRLLGHWALFFDEEQRGRSWTAVGVDLSEFAGREITLRLESRAEDSAPGQAFWGSPRIALPPESKQAPAAAGPAGRQAQTDVAETRPVEAPW